MKRVICIECPNGCALEINEETLEVTGNRCKRGEIFIKSELTNPKRTIQTTIKTTFKEVPVVPVRVSSLIPKDKIFDVMKEIKKVVVDKKLKIGDVVIKDVLGLGADVIITSNKLNEI